MKIKENMHDESDAQGQQLTAETEALITNGLDFLNKAREELQARQAKFSVVSFWTAVEILMKVPLVHEHWTLACSGKKMERKKYLAGDFQSVTYDEACARLGDVLEKPLSKKTADLFNKVKNHRNRVVHFYHNELSEGDQRQVLTEQADAWFALNRLMREDWSSLFGWQLRAKLATDETRMLRSSEFYAGAKFRHESVQTLVAAELKANRSVTRCVICCQDSVIQVQPVQPLPYMRFYEEKCFVCHRNEPHVEIFCPNCQQLNVMHADGEGFCCSRCECELERYDAINPVTVTKDNMYRPVPAGCTDCDGHNTVCEFGDRYLCTACLTLHDSLDACDYCNYCSSSVPDLSAVFGCNFCDGNRETWDDN